MKDTKGWKFREDLKDELGDLIFLVIKDTHTIKDYSVKVEKALKRLDKKIDSLLKEAREEGKKDIIRKTNNLYTKFEDEKPPFTISRFEDEWNDGFYRGQLKAMESICVDVLGLSGGDELKKLADTSATKLKKSTK
jgi:hypothetical protein